MIEGHDAVLYDLNNDYSVLQIESSRLRSQLMWLVDITTVSSVTFNLDGKVRTLTFEHDPEENSLRGWLDNKELSEKNARRLYIGALSITQAGETDAAIPVNPPVYSITLHMETGNNEVLELYQINDSQFLIVINGDHFP